MHRSNHTAASCESVPAKEACMTASMIDRSEFGRCTDLLRLAGAFLPPM